MRDVGCESWGGKGREAESGKEWVIEVGEGEKEAGGEGQSVWGREKGIFYYYYISDYLCVFMMCHSSKMT